MKRFTKKGGLDFTDKNLSLANELGYSYIYNRLAELEDKLESGQLAELPLKVGKDVAYIDYSKGDDYPVIKDNFLIEKYEIYSYGVVACVHNPFTGEYYECITKQYGEKWFSSKEQAEQKLKN